MFVAQLLVKCLKFIEKLNIFILIIIIFTKNIITFFHHFLTFFKEKATFLRILTTTKWWSFDHHFPPSLVIMQDIVLQRCLFYLH